MTSKKTIWKLAISIALLSTPLLATSQGYFRPNLMMVHPCGNPADEWTNEYFTFENGKARIDVKDFYITTNWSFCAQCGPGSNFIKNQDYIDQLNATSGCSADLFVSLGDYIMPYQKVMVFTGPDPSHVYDFSGECDEDTVSVIFLNHNNVGIETLENPPDDGLELVYMYDISDPFGSLTYFGYQIDNLSGALGDFVQFPEDYEYGVRDNELYDNDGGCITVLPIELASFTAVKQENWIDLLWTTASETNNDFFTLEKCTDGINFQSIGTLSGQGNSHSTVSYQFKDTEPYTGTAYYRLKQTDFDGAFTYSDIVAVDYTGADVFGIRNIFLQEKNVNARFYTPNSKFVKLEIIDAMGKVMYSHGFTSTGGAEEIAFNFNRLSSGIYFLRLTDGIEVDAKKFKL